MPAQLLQLLSPNLRSKTLEIHRTHRWQKYFHELGAKQQLKLLFYDLGTFGFLPLYCEYRTALTGGHERQ